MTANYYYITCLTNLHVGSGDVNFNIVDNEVERDPVTGYPTINASGVKGAFRQFFEENKPESTKKLFGSPVIKSKDKDVKDEASTPGSLKFLSAQMLGRPARASKGTEAYYMTTTIKALEQFCHVIEALGCVPPFEVKDLQSTNNYYSTQESVAVEGYYANTALPENSKIKEELKKRFGKSDFLILSDETFRKIPLPVIARNKLEVSDPQLWYEEFVPHKSVFWFVVLGNNDDLKEFNEMVNGKVIQFGGNASVGYGFCKIEQGGI